MDSKSSIFEKAGEFIKNPSVYAEKKQKASAIHSENPAPTKPKLDAARNKVTQFKPLFNAPVDSSAETQDVKPSNPYMGLSAIKLTKSLEENMCRENDLLAENTALQEENKGVESEIEKYRQLRIEKESALKPIAAEINDAKAKVKEFVNIIENKEKKYSEDDIKKAKEEKEKLEKEVLPSLQRKYDRAYYDFFTARTALENRTGPDSKITVNNKQLEENNNSLEGLKSESALIEEAVQNTEGAGNLPYKPAYTKMNGKSLPSEYSNDLGDSIPADNGNPKADVNVPKGGQLNEKQRLNNIFDKVAYKYGVPPDILKSIGWLESSWDTNPSNDAKDGKIGVMQVNGNLHEFAKGGDANDPVKNIEYSARHLKSLFDNIKKSDPKISDKDAWNWALQRLSGSAEYAENINKTAKEKPWKEYLKESSSPNVTSTGTGVMLEGVRAMQQHDRSACGRTAVAVALNYITHSNKFNSRNTSYSLEAELENHSGISWDCRSIVPKTPKKPYDDWPVNWDLIEESLRAGYPVVIGLNSPFSPTGRGHILTICGIDGDKVTYADSNGGKIKTTTKQAMQNSRAYPGGKFCFIPSRIIQAKRQQNSKAK